MSTYTPFETEMFKIMKELKSEMNTRFDAVDTRFDRLEIWNDKAFVAIEDLTDGVRAE